MLSEKNTVLEAFQSHLQAEKRSEHTIRTYVGAVRQMLDWVGKDPGEITREDLERYRVHLAVEKNSSKNTLYISIKAIQAFFRYLGSDVADGLTPPRRPKSIPRYLSEEEVSRLLKAAEGNPRDYAILVTLAYTGLRVSELCNLNIEDVDFSEKTIRVISGKGDKDRIVIFEENTENAIVQYLRVRAVPQEGTPLFTSTRRKRITPRSVELMIQKYARQAGITKKVTPHVLRHTMATSLLKHGADIRIIQQLLGHSSLSTTEIYTHVDEEMLRQAYRKSKPKY